MCSVDLDRINRPPTSLLPLLLHFYGLPFPWKEAEICEMERVRWKAALSSDSFSVLCVFCRVSTQVTQRVRTISSWCLRGSTWASVFSPCSAVSGPWASQLSTCLTRWEDLYHNLVCQRKYQCSRSSYSY